MEQMIIQRRVQAPRSSAIGSEQVDGLKKVQQQKNAITHQKDKLPKFLQFSKVAIDSQTGEQVDNKFIFNKARNGQGSNSQLMFIALVTKDLKKKFDAAYLDYKDSLCEVVDIETSTVKELLQLQTKEFFEMFFSLLKQVKQVVMEKIKNSEALKALEQLLHDNKQFLQTGENDTNHNHDLLVDEKELFDLKVQKGNFSYIAKRKEFYDQIIKTLDVANQQMQKVMTDAKELLNSIIQVSSDTDKTIDEHLKSIIDDCIKFDLNSQEVLEFGGAKNMQDAAQCMNNSEDGVPMIEDQFQGEMSLFSQFQPSTCYFKNIRNIENKSIFTISGKEVQKLNSQTNKWEKVFSYKYNAKLVLVPGKNSVYVVGGSNDIEGKQVDNQITLINEQGEAKQCKPMIQKRCKTGACIAMLTSEANTQFQKTYMVVFGGTDDQNNVIKSVEKFNTRANIWQTMADLNEPRYNSSGTVLVDSLYVFGGIGMHGQPLNSIERLRNLSRTSLDKFEVLNLRIPNACSDIGLVPMMISHELLLVGGFSKQVHGNSLSNILKFSVTDEEHLEEIKAKETSFGSEVDGFKPDFFPHASMVKCQPSDDKLFSQVTLYGALYKHTIDTETFVISSKAH